jgi:hypothetical protein
MGSGGSSGAAGAAGNAAAKACVHDSDCAVANLCAGNNGQECRGGFCVATGKPHVCSDGVGCTTDICDVNVNACSHKSNDAACADKQFCDSTRGCLEKLPCSDPGGDAVCDRLNPGLSACTGMWKCDLAKSYCVREPEPCGERPNAAVTCSVAEAKPACAWTCNPEYVDVNADLNVVGKSNGCECHVTDAEDRPTLEMLDKNCDGIVGNKAKAIFVATTGDDANPGTIEKPKRTIRAGIDAARSSGRDVYVASGSYPESVTIASGVSLFGGYDAEKGWSRAKENETRIQSPKPIGVLARDISAPTELQLFAVTSAAATERGTSSYAVKVIDASKQFTIRGSVLSAGAGADGLDGQKGTQGSDGKKGIDAKASTGGDGGPSTCGAKGGRGGDGPKDSNPSAWEAWAGNAGLEGEPIGFGGGEPGDGGSAGACKLTGHTEAGDAPTLTRVGGQGARGSHGNPGYRFGKLDKSTGNYIATVGEKGATGKPGGGGGGGGSGGSGRCHSGLDCVYRKAGGGGGGGSGGCGGNGGEGGQSGGGSFAILSVNALILLEDTRLFTSTGGNGGKGADGGPGGNPGGGGLKADGEACAGNGADGGKGGAGGQGGGGAGGNGGPSVGIVYSGPQPIEVRVDFVPGSPGAVGNGGLNGETRASSGDEGVVEKARAITS